MGDERYTPGPWQIDGLDIQQPRNWQPLSIATVDADMTGPDEAQANVRLIAAAPDMFGRLGAIKDALLDLLDALPQNVATVAVNRYRLRDHIEAIQAFESEVNGGK